jgi:hypothetical protein
MLTGFKLRPSRHVFRKSNFSSEKETYRKQNSSGDGAERDAAAGGGALVQQ